MAGHACGLVGGPYRGAEARAPHPVSRLSGRALPRQGSGVPGRQRDFPGAWYTNTQTPVLKLWGTWGLQGAEQGMDSEKRFLEEASMDFSPAGH